MNAQKNVASRGASNRGRSFSVQGAHHRSVLAKLLGPANEDDRNGQIQPLIRFKCQCGGEQLLL